MEIFCNHNIKLEVFKNFETRCSNESLSLLGFRSRKVELKRVESGSIFEKFNKLTNFNDTVQGGFWVGRDIKKLEGVLVLETFGY